MRKLLKLRNTLGNQTINTIEINGEPYRANRPRPVVDGFRPVNQSAVPQSQVSRQAHSPAQHVVAHKPIPSKTLMRAAVKKPQIQSPAQIKAQTRTDILSRVPKQTIAPKVSYGSVDPIRLKKAAQMVQNPAVSRYGSNIEVRPYSSDSLVSPSRPSTDGVQPAQQPVNSQHLANLAASLQRQTVPAGDIFEQALAGATSHEQTYEDPKAKRKGLRNLLVATGIASFLFMIGFAAYLNVPAISIKMAATHAGFQAKLPSYSPVGYSFGNLSYGPGNVTVNYKSAGSQKFEITQKQSSWDSDALLNNFVASANKSYQTYERAGRTIYFFGNNTATWVDNGIWYTVNGNNSLTKSQLLDLASSI
jgi:hypothetical protein